MLALGKRSSAAYEDFGNWLLASFRKTNDGGQLREGIRAYRQAVELYPNSSLGHAQLAWALHLAGDLTGSSREAEEALRLDALNPHQEIKLGALKINDPALNASGILPATDAGNAEQLMLKLRNAKKK